MNKELAALLELLQDECNDNEVEVNSQNNVNCAQDSKKGASDDVFQRKGSQRRDNKSSAFKSLKDMGTGRWVVPRKCSLCNTITSKVTLPRMKLEPET
ncbi:unnamed protein product [Enterobius vermicularis]|uniref:GATA-type domain-containing protein n=1 Tax=Enterobius vermicularis TaxID=51028 RepID=A0A0N4VI79_ENTVE|nr:unnamed protein product [Enterobius vermicularis]